MDRLNSLSRVASVSKPAWLVERIHLDLFQRRFFISCDTSRQMAKTLIHK